MDCISTISGVNAKGDQGDRDRRRRSTLNYPNSNTRLVRCGLLRTLSSRQRRSLQSGCATSTYPRVFFGTQFDPPSVASFQILIAKPRISAVRTLVMLHIPTLNSSCGTWYQRSSSMMSCPSLWSVSSHGRRCLLRLISLNNGHCNHNHSQKIHQLVNIPIQPSNSDWGWALALIVDVHNSNWYWCHPFKVTQCQFRKSMSHRGASVFIQFGRIRLCRAKLFLSVGYIHA